jgi:hypothetical protein
MDKSAILLSPIEIQPIFEKLFKNDVVIYGRFVRQILIEGTTLPEFSNDKLNTIHCYAKSIYRDIIERDLYVYICDTILYTNKTGSGNVTVTYSITIDECPFMLEILYLRSIIDYSPRFYENELQCIIDIDGLCIDRTGIRSMELFQNTPYLFSYVLNNIRTKMFNFKPSLLRLTKLEKKYIQSLLNNGYVNLNSKITEEYRGKTDILDVCSICYESDNKSYIKLECNHIYHKECLRVSIDLFYTDTSKSYFKCPYCSAEYTETELMIAD